MKIFSLTPILLSLINPLGAKFINRYLAPDTFQIMMDSTMASNIQTFTHPCKDGSGETIEEENLSIGSSYYFTSDGYPGNYKDAPAGKTTHACVFNLFVPSEAAVTLTVIADDFDVPSANPDNDPDNPCGTDAVNLYRVLSDNNIPENKCPTESYICLCDPVDTDIVLTVTSTQSPPSIEYRKDATINGLGFRIRVDVA